MKYIFQVSFKIEVNENVKECKREEKYTTGRPRYTAESETDSHNFKL
jgi:hypothetical protein